MHVYGHMPGTTNNKQNGLVHIHYRLFFFVQSCNVNPNGFAFVIAMHTISILVWRATVGSHTAWHFKKTHKTNHWIL